MKQILIIIFATIFIGVTAAPVMADNLNLENLKGTVNENKIQIIVADITPDYLVIGKTETAITPAANSSGGSGGGGSDDNSASIITETQNPTAMPVSTISTISTPSDTSTETTAPTESPTTNTEEENQAAAPNIAEFIRELPTIIQLPSVNTTAIAPIVKPADETPVATEKTTTPNTDSLHGSATLETTFLDWLTLLLLVLVLTIIYHYTKKIFNTNTNDHSQN